MQKYENLLLRYFHYLDAKGRAYNLSIGLLCSGLITLFDHFSPVEFEISFFYLLPITFVAWFAGFRSGLSVALLCAGLWSFHRWDTSVTFSLCNSVVTLLFFVSVAALLKKTRQMWEKEKELSRTDPLTGAKNLRAFSELVEHEMLRSRRDGPPYSLAYLDLDNFKSVNDTYGHSAGDNLLTAIIDCILNNLRKTDVVGRLGGDEFAIFFPETDQGAVQVVMSKVSRALTRIMVDSPSPTTFSIGVVTCSGGVHSLDKMLNQVDSLMYEVKRSGKNSIRYALYVPADDAE